MTHLAWTRGYLSGWIPCRPLRLPSSWLNIRASISASRVRTSRRPRAAAAAAGRSLGSGLVPITSSLGWPSVHPEGEGEPRRAQGPVAIQRQREPALLKHPGAGVFPLNGTGVLLPRPGLRAWTPVGETQYSYEYTVARGHDWSCSTVARQHALLTAPLPGHQVIINGHAVCPPRCLFRLPRRADVATGNAPIAMAPSASRAELLEGGHHGHGGNAPGRIMAIYSSSRNLPSMSRQSARRPSRTKPARSYKAIAR
jgi:hypothetical protein